MTRDVQAASLMACIVAHSAEMVELLQQIVNLESPSYEKLAVDKLGQFLTEQFKALGAQVDVVPQERVGDHLAVRWGEGTDQVTILCHMDTVWPLGTIAERPFRVEDGKAYGPGTFDMKGGIVIALYALLALGELGCQPKKRIVVLVNSDEELGSPTSQELIELHAKDSDYVLVPEPGNPPTGALKTSRKGVGRFEMLIRGKAAHSGANHEKGISAIEELARQILKLHALTDYDTGVTVNVGVVSGGIQPNVVPAQARAEIDLRVTSAHQAKHMVEKILSLKATRPGIEMEIKGGINRPPMERSPQIVALYEQAKRLGAKLGLELEETSTGAASDGNFTAALGIPTLDGLGAVGDGAHAITEHVIIQSLIKRAALLGVLLLNLDQANDT